MPGERLVACRNWSPLDSPVKIGLYRPISKTMSFREEWEAIRDASRDLPNVELAREATRVLCEFRRNNPWAFDAAASWTPGNPFPGSYNLTRAFWDTQCNEPIPVSGVAGGQCVGVSYTIFSVVESGALGGWTLQSGNPVVGPINTATVDFGPTGWRQVAPFYPQVLIVNINHLNGDTTFFYDTRIATPARDARAIAYAIRRTDGQPDICGDRYPDPQVPIVPPSTTYNTDVRIGGQLINAPITVTGLVTNNWPDFTFTPTIQIGDINVSFDVGGVEIDYPENPVLPGTPPSNNTVVNNINNVQNTVNNIQTTVENEFESIRNQAEIDIERIIQKIEECCCNDDYVYTPRLITSSTFGGLFNIPENTVAIVVEVVGDFNLKTPMQEGSGDAPRVYHWGSIGIGYFPDSSGTRIPLQWAVQSIDCAEHAKTVTIWPTYNNRARVTAIVREESE